MTKEKTCFISNDYPVSLYQSGRNNFKVVYGLQSKSGLTYEQAATELGSCLMHALACDDLLDNR